MVELCVILYVVIWDFRRLVCGFRDLSCYLVAKFGFLIDMHFVVDFLGGALLGCWLVGSFLFVWVVIMDVRFV